MTYRLLSPPVPVSTLGCWEPHVAPFTQLVGYSKLGHVFLFNELTNEFAVLHPFRQAYKNYGRFESVAEFESKILSDSGFSEYVLKPAHQLAIQTLLGVLTDEDIYIPTPYPFLGGSEEPDTYIKGNIWTSIEIVGMSHGYE